jgi:hypothetical protein
VKSDGRLIVRCGLIPGEGLFGVNTIFGLDEQGAVYMDDVLWASSMERWIKTEAIAAGMQDTWRPWSVGSIIVISLGTMIDLGIATGFPRLTEDALPFTTWWGDEIVRVQVSHPKVIGCRYRYMGHVYGYLGRLCGYLGRLCA